MSNSSYIANFTATPLQTQASVSGRVFDPQGRGLRNAVVTLTDAQGVTRTAVTSAFGLYTFENVPTGQTYTVRVTSKRYRFQTLSLIVEGNVANADFTGAE